MYNFLSKYRKILKYIAYALIFVVTILIFYFAPLIFTEPDVYFYALSSIVQGFIALVALLGAIVVFKVQLEDQAIQRLSDGVEKFVRYYRGEATGTYTPTQMVNACKEILDEKTDHGNKDYIKKVYEKMKETLASRNEARNRMVDFAVISFFNVSIAITVLLFTPVLIDRYWYIGGLLLYVNICLSIFSLYKALEVVRSTMGYSFRTG